MLDERHSLFVGVAHSSQAPRHGCVVERVEYFVQIRTHYDFVQCARIINFTMCTHYYVVQICTHALLI